MRVSEWVSGWSECWYIVGVWVMLGVGTALMSLLSVCAVVLLRLFGLALWLSRRSSRTFDEKRSALFALGLKEVQKNPCIDAEIHPS